MIHTDGIPTIANAHFGDPGDETSHNPHVEPGHIHTLALTDDELELLAEALDSHRYWQLSDEYYRDSGFVNPPGADDPSLAAQIRATEHLEDKLRSIIAHIV